MKFRTPFIPMAAIVCAASLIALRDAPPDTAPPALPAPAPPALDAEVAAPRVPALLRHAAESAPSDVTTLIVARDLAEARNSDACKSALSIVETLDLFPSSRSAWAALAKQLGMPPEQAFDELLGEQVLFISRDNAEAGASWALTSRVSIASAKRLGAALGATPRSQFDGLPVYAMENGAFVLHIRSEKGTNTAWITVGPGNRTDLFRHLIAPDANTRSLASEAPFNDLIAALPEAGDAFLYRRLSPAEPDFAVGAIRVAGDSLITTYAARSAIARKMPDGVWSRQQFDALNRGAAITVVESGQTSAGRFLDAAADGTLGPIKGIAALFQPFSKRHLLTPRSAFTIRRAPGNDLGVAYAVATPDTDALAPEADQFMAAQLAALFPKNINAADRIDPGGLAPEATRTVSLRGTGVAGLFRDKDAAVFAWSLTPNDGQSPTGWWTAGINPDAIERTARVLTSNAEPGQWSAIGEARPVDLAALLESTVILPISPTALSVMHRIDRVTLSERRLSPEKVVGSVSVDFVPPPPAPPAPGG
ncbi:MAG: hypothetical protein H6812_02855 [Phycisphaeraceae bacterium]|nr:hypothetical protein [Phycisphaerales bacterium]MCB9842179.1 hypothetical protein [Phycisphaeraceae bacterium]